MRTLAVVLLLIAGVWIFVFMIPPQVRRTKSDLREGEPPSFASSENATRQTAAVPFVKTIPFAKGELAARPQFSIWKNNETLSAIGKPVALWPDGSVRWLRVNGLRLEGEKLDGLTVSEKSIPPFPANLSLRVNESEDGILVLDAEGETLTILRPSASALAVDLPKEKQPSEIDYLDREGQYSWAQPVNKLSRAPRLQELVPNILHAAREEHNPVFSVYLFQGNFGPQEFARDLEWQLRAKVYHAAPIIEAEMTWVLGWPAKEYALASAKWHISTAKEWEAYGLPGDSEFGRRLVVHSNADGSNSLLRDGTSVSFAHPSENRDGIVAIGDGRALGVGILNLTRLGPNHLSGNREGVEVAMWSESSGKALDLRRSSGALDFGVGPGDLSSDGTGFSQTLRVTLTFFPTKEEASAVVENFIHRRNLLLPSSDELDRTAALGPFKKSTLRENAGLIAGVHANLLFLVRSRDYWKWYGLANFGDFRTNFALGHNPDRGLYPGRWALNGRYGWRNNSSGISWPLIASGLFLEDREIVLAGIDQALHTMAVDTKHGSLFRPVQGNEGAMHRRGRDHWSGEPQAQYSPSLGLYLAQWLTGDGVAADSLRALREFSINDGGRISPFPAQAWILRYMETHRPEDLQTAIQLLETTTEFFQKNAVGVPLRGPAVLFAKSPIRREGDGLRTLIAFHEATGDDRYLYALEDSVFFHKFNFPENEGIGLGPQGVMGYLLAQGVQFPERERAFLKSAAESLQMTTPDLGQIDSGMLNYQDLVNVVLTKLPPVGSPAYRESAAICGRAGWIFYAVPYFGANSEFVPHAK